MQQPFTVTAPEITLSPTEGELSAMVTVVGNGFGPSGSVTLYYSEGSSKASVGRVTTSTNGDFTFTFAIPASIAGTHNIIAEDKQGNSAQAVFNVVPPKIELSPAEGAVSTMVDVTGKSFYVGGIVSLYYSQQNGKAHLGDVTASANGDFTFTFAIPASTAGEHTIIAEDEQGNSVQTIFTVSPVISMSSASGSIGDDLTVSGNGFGAKSNVTIQFGGIVVAQGATNNSGSFQTTFQIVPFGSGSYDVSVTDDNGNQAKAKFAIIAAATLTPAAGSVGTQVMVKGKGFKAGSPVTVSYDTNVVATQDSDSKGTFATDFTVPRSRGGSHEVKITDGTNTVSATFAMETQAPPAPQLVSPTDESKAGQPVSFHWGKVNDPSGVTYTLQVATSKDFASQSIVMEKEELTTSDYTVANGEKLASRSKDKPYYWRVKAVDGASNESDWSAVWSFYVGRVFQLPSAAAKVLIGLGIAAFGFFCFWLGRKYTLRVHHLG
jgi:hypothetical protein